LLALTDRVLQLAQLNSVFHPNPDIVDLVRLFVDTKLTLNVSTSLYRRIVSNSKHSLEPTWEKGLLQCELSIFGEMPSAPPESYLSLVEDILTLPDERTLCAGLSFLERASALLLRARLERLVSPDTEEEDANAVRRLDEVLQFLSATNSDDPDTVHQHAKLTAQTKLWMAVFLFSGDRHRAITELRNSLKLLFNSCGLDWIDAEEEKSISQFLRLILMQGRVAMDSKLSSSGLCLNSELLRSVHFLSELLQSVGSRLMYCESLYLLVHILLPICQNSSRNSDMLPSSLLIYALDAAAQLSLSLQDTEEEEDHEGSSLVSSLFSLLDYFVSLLSRSAKQDSLELARTHISSYEGANASLSSTLRSLNSSSARAECLLSLWASAIHTLQLQSALSYSSEALQLAYSDSAQHSGAFHDLDRASGAVSSAPVSIASGRLLVRAMLSTGRSAEASGEHLRALYLFSRSLTIADRVSTGILLDILLSRKRLCQIPAPTLAIEAIAGRARIHLRRRDRDSVRSNIDLFRHRVAEQESVLPKYEMLLLEGDLCRLEEDFKKASELYRRASDSLSALSVRTADVPWDQAAVLLCRCRRRISVMEVRQLYDHVWFSCKILFFSGAAWQSPKSFEAYRSDSG
jgi:hypothetical protein